MESASPKEEYTAATFRPKINKILQSFVVPLHEHGVNLNSIGLRLPEKVLADEIDVDDIDKALALLHVDSSVNTAAHYKGGTSQAKNHLDDFIANKLNQYAAFKNDPGLNYSSNMSPYLHFGQISPLYIIQAVGDFPQETAGEFIEELVVRRELSMNFVHYNNHYDAFDSLPAWPRTALHKHRDDRRAYQYSMIELAESRTHDIYWNAAQTEMALTGKMHGYMRMYWGKKILEWGKTPEEAYETALYLNNKYSLDGRDPNGFAGIAWCFGKHDRPWKEREIFGTVRYMNAGGLDRKFEMTRYLEKIRRLGV